MQTNVPNFELNIVTCRAKYGHDVFYPSF